MADLAAAPPAGADAGPPPASMFPPGGPMPNYDNPETLAPANMALAVIFTVIAAASTALRVYGNTQNKAITTRLRIGLEDICIIIALGMSILNTVIVFINVKYGAGRHPIDIPLEWMDPNKQIWPSRLVPAIITHLVGLGIIKISLLIFFCRIIPSRKFMYACWAVGFFVVGAVVSSTFGTLFACNPIAAWWDFSIPRTACIDYVSLLVWMGALNATSDIIIVLLPVPVIYKSFLSKRKKIQVLTMFSLGLLVSVAAWVRTGYLIKASTDPSDLSWEGAIQSICCIIEINVALVCANAPQCRHYLTHRFPKMFSGLATTQNDSVMLSGQNGSSAAKKKGFGHLSSSGATGLDTQKSYPGCEDATSSVRSINNDYNGSRKEWDA